MAKAVGMIEVYGLVAALIAGDAGCKAANVVIEALDRNRPSKADIPVPLVIMVKFRGNVEDVKAAIEAAEVAANKVTGVVSKYIIANPSEDTEKLLKRDGLAE
ncbi:MAG: BMC domain-containing protein [Clostridiales bacterium]|jgi:microcompartment protein CcmL/EutN|nr:BMC domain-containing protein [Clostridiales bacterium]